MPFPEVERVKYANSPLENVVCQVRFPVILEIDSESPYVFQKLIREEFPDYEEQNEFVNEIDFAIQGQTCNPMTRVTSSKTHVFKSGDSLWRVSLNKNFLSLSTEGGYTTWENFVLKFSKPLSALIETYKPAYFTRVGLRYIDVFCRSKVGLPDCEWSELIRPEFLGLLGNELAEDVVGFNSVYDLYCQDKSCRMRITSNLVRKIDGEEKCFLLDSDTYTEEQVGLKDLKEKMNYLHARSTRLLRYAITEKLHQAMEPERL